MDMKISNEDCMELMSRYTDNYFNLAIVDPPYGIGESGSKNSSRGKLAQAKNYKDYHGNDKEPINKEYINELRRVSNNQIIWGANHFIKSIGMNSSCWIVWDKLNGGNDFADCELAYTSFVTAVRKFSFSWNGMIQGDMKNKEIRIHPNQKPVKLYMWLLSNYASPGQKIIDTHLGSGSSAIAAHYFGVDFVGCDIDKHYFDLAEQRIINETKQIKLF